MSIIKSCFKFLFTVGAGTVGILILWRLLQVPGEVTQLRTEIRALSTPVQITAIAYMILWSIRRHGLGLSNERFSIASTALKASIVFYVAGSATVLAGYTKSYSVVGFIAAALYSLRNNIAGGSLPLPSIGLSSMISIPVPSFGSPPELPISLCTPAEKDTVTTFRLHLGREAKSSISFARKHLHLLSSPLHKHTKKLAKMLGSKACSGRSSERLAPDPRNHLSRNINRGYLLDSSKAMDETLKAISDARRRGVEVSLQFTWVRTKKGLMARHVLVASSDELQAFSRFETDFIRKVPFVSFLETRTAVNAMKEVGGKMLLKRVEETYMRNTLPLNLSYELATIVDKVALRDYVENSGGKSKPLSLPFPDGHLLLVGDKSSGKTRFVQRLVSVLDDMNVVTLIIDPYEEYCAQEHKKGRPCFNPFKPPLDVDVLTHSGSLLVFSPTLASVFSTSDPQGEVSKIVGSEEPSISSYLLEIAGHVDEESARLRASISQLAEETAIDEAIREVALPEPTRNVIPIHVPLHQKRTAMFLTELFLSWAASLAISEQKGKVLMIVEDADEFLNLANAPDILGSARDYGLSLVLISRNCARMVSSEPCFSVIVGFKMSSQQDLEAFQKLVGVRRDEPEGLQIEATISNLRRGECLLFYQSSFEFLRAKAVENQGNVISVA